MAAAEALSDGWAVCWQMITAAEGAAAAAAPKGVVRLAAVDVARVGGWVRGNDAFFPLRSSSCVCL